MRERPGDGRGEAASSWSTLLARASRSVRQVFGMPDYDRYLEHRRMCHPGEPVLGPRAFYAEQVERRYGAGVGRCC
ncbi:MAG TPA: YbdD/YjiX family protein [Gemmatimonadales bacterium]|jgi:uncharacterized short protein YbdD (DUF466 family)